METDIGTTVSTRIDSCGMLLRYLCPKIEEFIAIAHLDQQSLDKVDAETRMLLAAYAHKCNGEETSQAFSCNSIFFSKLGCWMLAGTGSRH